MSAPSSLERLRQDTEQRIRTYRVKSAGSCFILWRWTPVGWMALHQFHSQEAAENHLFLKLPCPESEM